jgi:hypothetical protein
MREKQIEEMALTLSEGGCGKECDCIEGDKFNCHLLHSASVLYNAGYRKQEWISVDERLPEDGVWVLGYSAKSRRGGLCNCLKSYVREFGNYDDTTHWLPIPEFPKMKGE